MALKEQLDAIRAAGKERIPPDTLAVMLAATEAQQRSGISERVLGPGSPLPPFALENQRGEIVRSAELLDRGPLVLTVYRGVW